jgi:glycosyltransferase involved in cell wall biosynthesis
MRIAFLCNEYPPHPHGGIGTMVQMLAEGLAEQSHAVYVFGIYAGARSLQWQDQNGVAVLRVPKRGGRLSWWRNQWLLAETARRVAREQRLDVLEVPDYRGDSAFFHSLPCPVVVRFNNPDILLDQGLLRWEQRLSERVAIARAKHFIAVSEFIRDRARAFYRTLERRSIPVIYNTVDESRHTPGGPGQRRSGQIVHWGKTDLKKNTRNMFQAMRGIAAACAEAELVFIGDDNKDRATGRSCAELSLEGLDPSVAERIRLVGRVDRSQLSTWAHTAAVGLFPSIVEAFPLVVAEALAFGLPLVVARQGPAAEIVKEGVAGLVCDGNDPDDIARAVVAILRDRALRDRLSAGARATAETVLSYRNWVASNVALFERLADGGSPEVAG